MNLWGTILVCLILTGIVAAAIAGIVRDRRSGRSSCGSGCSGCAFSGECHKQHK